MALSASALVTLAEVKQYLNLPASADSKNEALEAMANRASDIVSQYLDRTLVNTASITEYHTMRTPAGHYLDTAELNTRQWPIVTVTSVHEDTNYPHVYGSSELLTVDTDYTVSKPTGRIYRTTSGTPRAWASGFRCIKVIYTAGYTQAAVPDRIKAVVLRLCSLMWGESERSAFGVQSQSDQLGNFTRFSSARLTDDMKDELAADRRNRFFETGEVDA